MFVARIGNNHISRWDKVGHTISLFFQNALEFTLGKVLRTVIILNLLGFQMAAPVIVPTLGPFHLIDTRDFKAKTITLSLHFDGQVVLKLVAEFTH